MSRRKRGSASTTKSASSTPKASPAASVLEATAWSENDDSPEAVDRRIDAAVQEFVEAETRGLSDSRGDSETVADGRPAEPATDHSATGRAYPAKQRGAPDVVRAPSAPVELPAPYAVLADYERRSFAHVAASADQVQAPGLWRGIAFRVGTRRLMASITEVFEILPVLHHTSVPGTQSWLLGVVNVRGTLVPLVDLRGFIEGERTPLGDTSRLLVARHGANPIGLLVEEVLGQRNLTAENDPLKLENDSANWARFVPAHFELDGKLWGVFSIAALVATTDFLHAAA